MRTLTQAEIFELIVDFAGTRDFARSSCDDDDQDVIAEMQHKLNSVYLLTGDDNDDLLQQRDEYPDYIQDADIGDPVYFDGEALCCRATVESWVENPERGKLYTFNEYADMLIYQLILERMDTLCQGESSRAKQV